jgi:hypothetical protein
MGYGCCKFAKKLKRERKPNKKPPEGGFDNDGISFPTLQGVMDPDDKEQKSLLVKYPWLEASGKDSPQRG